MHRFLCTAGILFVAAAVAWADEPQKKPPADKTPAADSDASSASEQMEAVQTEMSDKQRDIIKRYRAAEDDTERQKILEEYKQLQSEILNRYAKIVDKHPDDEAVFPALQMLVASPDHAAKATQILIKHHLNNEQMGMICLQLGMQGATGAEKLVRAVAEKSKSHAAQGMALLGLGQMLFARSNQPDIDEAERDRVRAEAKKTLRTVVDKYADVDAGRRNAGDWASGVLFEVEHLAVGLPVPDLEGEDLEGAAFKLSDYRGKVVFLDFWAHW